MSVDFVLFGSMFLLGLGGSLHCLGMCGPLVMAVPFPKKHRNSGSKLLYFFGKAMAYGILGILIGLLGLKAIWGDSQRFLSVLAGILILLMVIFPIIKPRIGKFYFHKSFQSIFQKIKQQPRWYHFFQLGFLNGLLPCGMVYMAMAAALTSGSPIEGFFAMLFFGFGTTPILWLIAVLRTNVKIDLKKKLKPLTITLSVLVGVLLILRGLNLGIPHISPKMDTSQEIESHGHHHHSH